MNHQIKNALLFVVVTILLLAVGAIPKPALADAPTEIFVGLKVEQITGINTQKENFGVVASLRMEWKDPGWLLHRNPEKPRNALTRQPPF